MRVVAKTFIAIISFSIVTITTSFAIPINMIVDSLSLILLSLFSSVCRLSFLAYDRGVTSVLQGFCIPSITSMWAFWAPREENAKLLTVTFSGRMRPCVSVSVCACVCV